MWLQKDRSARGISWGKVLDWVVIDGVLWVEVLGEEVSELCIARC